MFTIAERDAIAEGFAEIFEEGDIAPEVLETIVEDYDFGPYCFVCGRCTCHVGEHDDLYAAGLIEYNRDGQIGLVTWAEGVTQDDLDAHHAGWWFYGWE